MKFRKLALLVSFSPLLAVATTANYYSNAEFTLYKKNSILEKIQGEAPDALMMPPTLARYEKEQDLLSGHYVLNKPLYANEILILADGPYFGTVWRSGTEVRAELKALAALVEEPVIERRLQRVDYQIIRSRVYTKPVQNNSESAFVYQVPGFQARLKNDQDCTNLMSKVSASGYQGRAFSCKGTEFRFTPVYSHNV